MVPIIGLADYLEMTEAHCRNNLLRKALIFFEQKVLPSWNETIKALLVAEDFLQQAVQLDLVDACFRSLVQKAQADPHLLGAPMKNLNCDEDSEDADDAYRPNARRKLFVIDWKSEDLTVLSLPLFDAIIRSMNQHGVPPEFVASSVCQYTKRWVLSSTVGDETVSIYKRKTQRDVLEAVEKLLPYERGLIPCTLLFEMLRYAIVLEASSDCRTGFEIRIGKQLDRATVRDLLIPSQGYAKEVQYDIECLRRILRNFCGSYSPSSQFPGYVKVAELIEKFLAEIAADIDLKMNTFLSIVEMSSEVPAVTRRNSDGIYMAIDIYFHKHRYLTESEREQVCRVLDCRKLSLEACEHAAKNERLPLRVVVQALFAAQLHIRDTITKEVALFPDDKMIIKEEMEEEGAVVVEDEAKVIKEMKIMSNKVMELERECLVMRKELEKSCSLQQQNNHNDKNKEKNEKLSMWKEMKRKFGCIASIHDCNCQVKKKKVHPRFGI